LHWPAWQQTLTKEHKMIPVLIGVIALSTVASVGTTAYSISEQKDMADKAAENQKDYTLATAYVDYGASLNQAPGAIPMA
jgi:hypothetical protein